MSDWTDNPFAQAEDDNPFADPSVTAATSTVPEYNPFDKPAQPAAAAADPVSQGASSFAKSAPAPVAAPPPAAAEPAWASEPEPAAAKQPEPQQAPRSDPAEEERKREYERRQQAAQTQQHPPGYRPANWPPFPVACPTPFRPCFHHNIKGEIPEWGRLTLKQVYYCWQLTVICLSWNFITALASLDYGGGNTGTSALIATCFFVCFLPCSYLCWFHPLYSAMRKDSSLRFGWFFFVFGFQFLSSSFFAIGFPGTGASGIFIAITIISKGNKVVGIMVFTAAALWIILALINVYLIRKVLGIYRSTGQSMQRMEDEWKKERDAGIYKAATSEYGQAAISGAVKGAASTAANQASSQASQGW